MFGSGPRLSSEIIRADGRDEETTCPGVAEESWRWFEYLCKAWAISDEVIFQRMEGAGTLTMAMTSSSSTLAATSRQSDPLVRFVGPRGFVKYFDTGRVALSVLAGGYFGNPSGSSVLCHPTPKRGPMLPNNESPSNSIQRPHVYLRLPVTSHFLVQGSPPKPDTRGYSGECFHPQFPTSRGNVNVRMYSTS